MSDEPPPDEIHEATRRLRELWDEPTGMSRALAATSPFSHDANAFSDFVRQGQEADLAVRAEAELRKRKGDA